MYRRLVMFGLSVVAVAVVALIIPLGMAARDIVATEEMNEIANRAHTVADAWEIAWQRDATQDRLPEIPIADGDGEVTLILPNGEILGPAIPDEAADVVALAASGRSTTVNQGSAAFAAAPVLLAEQTGVVLVAVDADGLREGLTPRLVALGVVSVTLLGFAAVAAWLLARRTVQPIRELAATADAIADGDLAARAADSKIPEVHDVGVALNRMADRVVELLDDERSSAAELAHQLRTPLTVLTIDIDSVSDDEVRTRLQEDALALQRTTDEIIVNARRPTREGLRARCDATAVVADRARFWQVLAEDQNRPMTVDIAQGPMWVRLTDDDLATLTDILLQNIFNHTPESVAFELTVEKEPDGAVLLTLNDEGPGFTSDLNQSPGTDDSQPEAPGSTGLGLSIAERLAKASGGTLTRQDRPTGGASLLVKLGRASD